MSNPYELAGFGFSHDQAKAMRFELARELDTRRRLYPGMIAKSQVSQEAADRQLAVLAEIEADLDFAFPTVAPAPDWPEPAFTWRDKVAELRREIELRAHVFPRMVAKHELTAELAEVRTFAFGNLLALYWERMFRWLPTDPQALAWRADRGAGATHPGYPIYRREVAAHIAATHIKQQELAL